MRLNATKKIKHAVILVGRPLRSLTLGQLIAAAQRDYDAVYLKCVYDRWSVALESKKGRKWFAASGTLYDALDHALHEDDAELV